MPGFGQPRLPSRQVTSSELTTVIAAASTARRLARSVTAAPAGPADDGDDWLPDGVTEVSSPGWPDDSVPHPSGITAAATSSRNVRNMVHVYPPTPASPSTTLERHREEASCTSSCHWTATT